MELALYDTSFVSGLDFLCGVEVCEEILKNHFFICVLAKIEAPEFFIALNVETIGVGIAVVLMINQISHGYCHLIFQGQPFYL